MAVDFGSDDAYPTDLSTPTPEPDLPPTGSDLVSPTGPEDSPDDEEDMDTSEDKNASFSSSVFICRFLNDRVKLERMSYPVEGVRMMTSIGLFFFVFSLSVIVDVDVLLL